MKRICAMILLLCVTFSMAACSSKAPDPTIPPTIPTADPTDPTAAPTVPTEPDPIVFRHEGLSNRENVPEFIALLFEKYLPGPSDPFYPNYLRKYSEYNCYNDTPPGVFEETGIQFFNFGGYRQSFLMFDSKIHFINDSLMWPTSITNAIPYDYDGDGVKDLIIAYWVETGGGFTPYIDVFNPVSKKFTQLFRKHMTNHNSVPYITASKDDSQTFFTVWSVKWDFVSKREVLDAENHLYKYTRLSDTYTVTGIAGHLKIVDGSLQFVPYTE